MRRRHTGCHHLLGNSVPASACMCSRQNTGPQVSHAIKSIQSSRCLSDLTQQPAQVSNPITVLPCSTSTGAKPSHQGRNSKHSSYLLLCSPRLFPALHPRDRKYKVRTSYNGFSFTWESWLLSTSLFMKTGFDMASFFPLRAAAHQSHISSPGIQRGDQLGLKESLVKDHSPCVVVFLPTEGSTVLEDYPNFPLDVKISAPNLVIIYSNKSQQVKNC